MGDSGRLWEFVLLLLLRMVPGAGCSRSTILMGLGKRISFDPLAPGVSACSGIYPFVNKSLSRDLHCVRFLKRQACCQLQSVHRDSKHLRRSILEGTAVQPRLLGLGV